MSTAREKVEASTGKTFRDMADKADQKQYTQSTITSMYKGERSQIFPGKTNKFAIMGFDMLRNRREAADKSSPEPTAEAEQTTLYGRETYGRGAKPRGSLMKRTK